VTTKQILVYFPRSIVNFGSRLIVFKISENKLDALSIGEISCYWRNTFRISTKRKVHLKGRDNN
jgi:hypothetical protein